MRMHSYVGRGVRAAIKMLIATLGVVAFVAFTPIAAFAFGSGNAAWTNYYAHPGDSSTWGPFCAGGGGSVVTSGLGVPACGPTGSTDIYLPGGEYTPGFQCVELSERFLYVTKGWTALAANGAEVAKVYAAAHHVTLVANGTAGVAPHVGDVMSFSYTSGFTDTGHTGVVVASSVNSSGNGSITLLSENVGSAGGNRSSFSVSGWRVASVFGYPDSEWVQSGSNVADGSFVSYEGAVYRIAGGAPIWVSSWTPFGGPQPTTALTAAQFDALAQYPANGTAVYDADPGPTHGTGYVFAGGAPLAVVNWANVGNPSYIGVDGYSLNNYASSGVLSHVLQYPANGTAVYDESPDASHGSGYVFAGGAPLAVTNWANVGSPHITGVDDAALNNYAASGAFSHVRQYPADGTAVFVDNSGSLHGAGSVFAGGAPMPVSNWANVGSPHITGVDLAALNNYAASGAYSHVRQFPADGTFLAPSTGGTYRVAGGFPFDLTDCSVIPCSGAVVIDGWDLTHTTTPAHLGALPADGTVVEGLPSGHYWSFTSGQRTAVPPSSGAVAVDDSSVAGFPIALAISTGALPAGTVGVRYSATLTATGGTAPDTWSLAPGSGPLPAGLKLRPTGKLSGKPKTKGTSAFTVMVVDAKGNTATRILSISIS